MDCILNALCEGLVVGLHLISLHSNPTYTTSLSRMGRELDSERYQSVTPGLYVRAPNGFTAGAYRNSFGKPSVYAGWTFSTEDETFAVTVGAVTGYRRRIHVDHGPGTAPYETDGRALEPVLVPSVRLPITDTIAVRLAYVPEPRKESTSVFHLAIETRF